jgi:flavin-dependent dehydrogenase
VHDVLVIGGGPAGSICATRLRQLGKSVLILEKERFPRFRLGESLLPQTLHVLESLGVLEEARALFLVKNGAQFHDGSLSTRFGFDAAFDNRIPYAFQVPREDYDTFLLHHAEAAGAEVRQGWCVAKVLFEDGRAAGAEAIAEDGARHTVSARFVVDATGRDAMLAHDARATQPIRGLENTAIYTHYRGAPREPAEREGDIHIVMFDGGWHWVIPFKDGRTSVGAVVTRAWMRANRAEGDDRDTLLRRALDAAPAMQRLLGAGEPLWPARSAADFSYRVGKMRGPGWVALGDAGGFIDPLFSTGVHIATWGAHDAGPAICAALEGDEGPLAAWEPRLRAGAEMFLSAVEAFYAGKLQTYMFTDNPRTYLRRAITSLLSGDVFGDARWARDMRTRLVQL